MFQNCSYHLLDSLIPPSAEKDKCIQDSLLRLESMCACSIVRSERNCQILSETPKPLHKIIMEAYLKDSYSFIAQNGEQNIWPRDEDMLVGLPELLYHWPHEDFILKEVMPKFQPRLSDFSFFSDILHKFYTLVVKTIIRTFLINFKDNLSHSNRNVVLQTHVNACKVRKINVSGFYTFYFYSFSEDYIGMMGWMSMDEPILNNNGGKLEFILDIDIQNYEISIDGIGICENPSHILNRFAYSQFNSPNSVVIRFNHVSVGCTQLEKLIKGLVHDSGTVSLKLQGDHHTDISAVMENSFKFNENQSTIISVEIEYIGFVSSSIVFVQYLKNLVHLDLGYINLNGKLDSLKHMHKGLLFLSLFYCQLDNADLAQLIDSCHQETLKELNLGYNDFIYDNNYNNLIRLCQKLTKVLVLKLRCCCLESWPINEIKLFFYSLKNMPNIINLDLTWNVFDVDTYNVNIMLLNENCSLRLLRLPLPIHFNEDYNSDEAKSFCSTIIEKINTGRSQLLYVEFEKTDQSFL
ncbi:unnamed protein product [Meganyctiphanes norvegica]|uniref:Uncharacterized protein n=1 Tax=Meganyctiphanes norvegica TaxID=48144 RepID=A0AAV2SFT9_MEGNR